MLWSVRLPFFRGKARENCPLVSLLIPARDEAANIGKTLSLLRQQSYQNIEIHVLDDGSADETAAIVRQHVAKDSRIQLRSGAPLPKGWLGKNWACHQLSQIAQGEYWLFIDADVQVGQGLIPSLVAERERHGLTLLSVFPDQELKRWEERIAVPMMHVLLLTLLPLQWVRLLPFPSMAAANGQVMLFEAEAYREYQFHREKRKEVIEDISIARWIKQLGLKAGVYVGNGLVSCRMYSGLGEIVDGFSKNLLAGFGHSIVGLLLYLSLTSWFYIGLFFLPAGYVMLAIFGLVLTNIALALLSRRPILETVLTHIPRVGTTAWIGIQSVYRKIKRQNKWKGRNIYLD